MAEQKEPKSWGDYCNAYRSTFGSRAYSVAEQQQVRFTRSVPGVCPLAETTHPLYGVGSLGHTLNANDGSLQRAKWHGWGDTSLLKQEGCQGSMSFTEQQAAARSKHTGMQQKNLPAMIQQHSQPHPHGVPTAAEGKKPVQQPLGKDGRRGLFGLLQGTEAGGVDSWIGNQMIDPTKGKHAVSAPTDKKRTVSFIQLLAHAAPGNPAQDAWIGNIAIDPARGKAHSLDPSSLRGRPNLFAVLQQQEPTGSLRSAEADAWIGNRLIQPNKGKKPVELPDEFRDHLFAATLKGGPPAEGCWSDMPPIGKRPLEPPSNSYGFVTAQQTMRTEDPLPPNTVVGRGKPCNKGLVPDPYHTAAKPEHVDMYSIMTYQPLTQFEEQRYQKAWNDSPNQPKKKPVPDAKAASSSAPIQKIDFKPDRTMRYVPFGGIAQEKGMTLDKIVLNRTQGMQLSSSGGTNTSMSGKISSSSGSGQARQQLSNGRAKRSIAGAKQ